MQEFIAKHQRHISGVLCGFDRLVFRGTLRTLARVDGMTQYLQANHVLLKEFDAHVEHVTARLKAASKGVAEAAGRPVIHVASPQASKETIARQIAERDAITDGLIAVLTSVEPCRTYQLVRDRAAQRLVLQNRQRQCLHLYHYALDPAWGLSYTRIQSWFPFTVQVGLNGREWLGRQLDAAGIRYERRDNCFPWVGDWPRAQALLEQQRRLAWGPRLDALARGVNPAHAEIFARWPIDYYWTTFQSEWAVDVVFQDRDVLRRLYPRLLLHALTTLHSEDVLRFLGRRLSSAQMASCFAGEVTTDLKRRVEGVRIKHRVNSNSVKLYDKAYTPHGAVLRAEATLNQTDDLKVYRPKEGDPRGPRAWRRLRRGIADLHRRTELSAQAINRYLDALAPVDDDVPLAHLVRAVTTSTTWRDRRVRGLRPFTDDHAVLRTISRGEYALTGVRNRDLQAALFERPASSPAESRRRSARVSRQLRLLRAHGILRKIQGTHRYQVTARGRVLLTAVITAMNATAKQLTALAAA